MKNNIDVADRLADISDEIKGYSEILFMMYEAEYRTGSHANALLALSKTMERYSRKIEEAVKAIKV